MKQNGSFPLSRLLATIAFTGVISSIAFPYVAGGGAPRAYADDRPVRHYDFDLLTDHDFEIMLAGIRAAKRTHSRFDVAGYETKVICRRKKGDTTEGEKTADLQ